jgi:pimeloyl-ACP methyl ester carboxylesterase
MQATVERSLVRLFGVGALLAMTSFATAGNFAERVTNFPLATGAKQRVLYVGRPSPRATLIMLPGGAGDVGLTRDGDVRHDKNFVVRTRQAWAARGYAVLIPDWIGHESLRGKRSSPDYFAIIEALIEYAHKQSAAPIFLLGTSQGSIAAANGAAHAKPGSIAGVILTESVSVMGGSHETVFDAGLSDIRVPALIVANRDDRCRVAPPEDAAKIAAAITHAPDVRVEEVSGGIDKSGNACGSLSPHGYYGIEDKVISMTDAWITKRIHG